MRQFMKSITFVALITLASLSSAGAQSFNCNYAKAPDEVMICNSPTLSGLDQQMSIMYFRIRNSLAGVQRAQLQNDQAAWLRGRQMCGGDPACLEQAYQRRIRQLSNY